LNRVKIGQLAANSPFKLSLLIEILNRFKYRLFSLSCGTSFCRLLYIDGQYYLVQVDEDLSVWVVTDSEQVPHNVILAQIKQILNPDAETQVFYEMAQQDKKLWEIVQPLVGLPLFRTLTVFEALISLIIEQHISWVAAQRAQHQLALWANNTWQYEDQIWYAPPTPQQLANATVDELKPLKITFKRMELMIYIAQQLVTGALDLESITNASIDEAYKSLLKIKGVGHWTAANVLSRGLGAYRYVTDNDVALQAAVNFYFFGEEGRIPKQTVNDVFEKYAEFAGLAAYFTLMRWVIDRYQPTNSL